MGEPGREHKIQSSYAETQELLNTTLEDSGLVDLEKVAKCDCEPFSSWLRVQQRGTHVLCMPSFRPRASQQASWWGLNRLQQEYQAQEGPWVTTLTLSATSSLVFAWAPSFLDSEIGDTTQTCPQRFISLSPITSHLGQAEKGSLYNHCTVCNSHFGASVSPSLKWVPIGTGEILWHVKEQSTDYPWNCFLYTLSKDHFGIKPISSGF